MMDPGDVKVRSAEQSPEKGTLVRSKDRRRYVPPTSNDGTFRRSQEFLFQVELPDRLAYGGKPAKNSTTRRVRAMTAQHAR